MAQQFSLTGGLNSAANIFTPQSKGFNLGQLEVVTSTTQKLFNDVEPMTLDNEKWYPVSQPYLPRVLIKFPTTVSENKTETNASIDLADDKYLEILPQNLMSFSCSRHVDTVGTMQLSLFDPTWGTLEETLVKNKGIFALRYGYPDSLMSPWFKVLTTSYSLEFKMSGVIIHISGILQGFQINLKKKFRGFGNKNQTISDIVRDIVKDLNDNSDLNIEEKNIFIEPTNEIFSHDKLDDPIQSQISLQQCGETDYEFIMKTLVPLAISKETKEGQYRFFIGIDPKTNKTEFHFHTDKYLLPKDSDKVPALTLFGDKNTALIHFNPLWNMTVGNLVGGSGTFSSVIDMNKNTLSQVKSMFNTPFVSDNPGGSFNVASTQKEDKDQAVPDKFKTSYIEGSNAYLQLSRETAEQSRINNTLFQATVEIVGNPWIKSFQKIAVIVFSPSQGSESQKLIHWTSGYFRVIGMTDTITAGRYTTKLDLITDLRSTLYTDSVPAMSSK